MKKLLGSLPLFWKLLVPSLALIILLGLIGSFLIVRSLTSAAQTKLNQDLLRSSLEARSRIHDRELYLLESANFAANLQGIAEANKAGDSAKVSNLLQSVLALKRDLNLLVATNGAGIGLAEFSRSEGDQLVSKVGTEWTTALFIERTIKDPSGHREAGYVKSGNRSLLAIAAPICLGAEACSSVGVTIAGIWVDTLAREAAQTSTPRGTPVPGLAIYDENSSLLSESGITNPAKPPTNVDSNLVRRNGKRGATDLSTLYAPLEIQGKRAGTLAVTLPTSQAFSAVRGAGIRLVLFLLIAMAGLVAIGALLSRFIVAQIRPLLETNRALGRGELSARTPVVTDDELGELAEGVNQMADQLEASYENLELRVSQRTEEVQRLLRERTDLFASIGHEFRTPLAVITRYVEMMLDPSYPKKPRWTSEAGHVIKESTNQLLLLINDILEMAKAEAGHVEMQLEVVSLPDFFKGIHKTLEGLSSGSRLKIRIDIPRQLPDVHADPFRLKEIVLNLVDNAVKYTLEGRVAISAFEHDEVVEVSVSDSGIGIPDDVGNRIFEPFYRVEGTKLREGQFSTGLGLALTKRFVEAQGGRIWFKRNLDGGTTFTFTLVPSIRSVGAQVSKNGKNAPGVVGGRLKPKLREDMTDMGLDSSRR